MAVRMGPGTGKQLTPLVPQPVNGTVHIGRQPIYGADAQLYGYELLFRDTASSTSAESNGDHATTATILAAFAEFDLASLLGGRPGFINLTRAFLTGELPVPFGPQAAILEILETIAVDTPVIAGAYRLAGEGYRLALDDFVWSPEAEPLLDVADIVKIDVLGLDWASVEETAKHCRRHGVCLLAERVEDADMLVRCQDAGFTLFQGYHLGRPQVLSAETLAPAQALALQAVSRLSDPEATVADIEGLLRLDPALTYRLLRIANSAASGVRRRVGSIRDAVVLVGLARLRAWLVLLSMTAPPAVADRLGEALARARTCELLGRRGAGGYQVLPDMAFTLGLLHGIAELLGIRPEQLQERLPPLAGELDAAMRGESVPLRHILDAVLAYERGDLATLNRMAMLADVASAYLEALSWSSDTASAVTT